MATGESARPPGAVPTMTADSWHVQIATKRHSTAPRQILRSQKGIFTHVPTVKQTAGSNR